MPTYINNIVKKSVIIKNNLYEISTLLLGVLHTIVIVNNYENLESIMQNIIEYNIFNSHSNFDFVEKHMRKCIQHSLNEDSEIEDYIISFEYVDNNLECY